ncbi:MAG TPA: DUF805 domain-containing protein [Trebonia sp.]|jgi:uncharacterized membrane protein YhaH (DUF805 family)|nr:DUF805 domain-containing protein [Trebonia sp.]
MSSPQNPQNPNPYADPVQEHIPGQAPWTAGQPGAQGQGQPGGQESPYGAYPQGYGNQQAGGGYQQPGSGYGGGYGAGYPRPTAYLAGAPVGFADAVRGAFAHPLTLRGRASRSAFWWFQLLAVIAYAVVSIISDRSTVAGIILDIIVGVPMIITNIALAVRRLHDSDHTGWWWWIGFVPLVGWIISIVFYVLPSTPGPNRYNTAR